MSAQRRGPWSQAEDAYLCQLVHTQGALNWVRIAQIIGTRSPKQCRERYHQNLKPTLNHDPISPEEGLLIERLVHEMGKRWADIARRLNGRSDNAVKNWWNGSMNRRRRLVLRRGHHSQEHNNFDERTQTLSFARPPNNRQLTIQSPHYTPMQGVEGPLLSPATSEASKAESMEGAPSLVSDNGTTFSTSPRIAYSPASEGGLRELPPLQSLSRESHNEQRRPSLPSLHDLSRGHRSLDEYPPLYEIASSNRRRFEEVTEKMSVPSPAFTRRSGNSPTFTFSSPGLSHKPFGADSIHPFTAPTSPVLLPPLRLGPPESRPSSKERDNRMNLSNLLA